MNYFKTTLLISALTALFMFIGYAIGGNSGAIIALIFAGVMNFMAFWNSDKVVLKMTGATLADRDQYKNYYDIVEKLVHNTNIPMPKLYVMQQDVPNAFATGRNPQNAAVAITTGIYEILNAEELSGVIAHELAHIEHRDTLISTITATFAGAISMIASMFMFMSLFSREDNKPHPLIGIIVMLVAPLAATIIQMAVSRNREYYADKKGGQICGNPLYLASALKKLESYSQDIRKNTEYSHEQEQKNIATSHMYIVNHFGGNKDGLFSTHPNTSNRIYELEKQATLMGIFNDIDKSSNKSFINPFSTKNVSNPGYTSDSVPNTTITALDSSSKKEKIDANVKNNPWL